MNDSGFWFLVLSFDIYYHDIMEIFENIMPRGNFLLSTALWLIRGYGLPVLLEFSPSY